MRKSLRGRGGERRAEALKKTERQDRFREGDCFFLSAFLHAHASSTFPISAGDAESAFFSRS